MGFLKINHTNPPVKKDLVFLVAILALFLLTFAFWQSFLLPRAALGHITRANVIA